MDAITVLFCTPGHCATKIHRKTDAGIDTANYNAGMHFEFRVYPISGIRELAKALAMLEPVSTALIIRGAPLATLTAEESQRRLKANFQTPPQGRNYFMVDIDKLALPAGVQLTKDTIEKVIDHVVNQLPVEFQRTSFYWQLSSSAGVKDASSVSMHLWYWLDRPISDSELKHWGKAVNTARGFNLIDVSLFNDVQAHYTAAPIFEGMDDPFLTRSGLIEKEEHEVALIPPATEQLARPTRKPRNSGNRTARYSSTSSGKGFDHFLAQIGDHEGGDGFHGPIIRAIASHVATVGRDDVDKEWLYETVRSRVLSADSSQHESDYINLKASRESISPAIESAMKKFGDAPARRSRVIHGQKPHFVRKTTTVAVAQQRIKQILKNIF